MRKSAQILVIILSFMASLQIFAFWLPQKIAEKMPLLLANQLAEQQPQTGVEILSQDLLTYIDTERQKSLTEDEHDFEKDLLQKLEEFHNDYMKSSKDFLHDRFAMFEKTLDQSDYNTKVPEGLEDIVEFWVHIFGVYDKNQAIFYNEADVGVVYSVLDFTSLTSTQTGPVEGLKSDILAEESQRLRKIIVRVAAVLQNQQDFEELDENEKRIFAMLDSRRDELDLSESALLENFTYRYGFAHRMKQAMATSTRYMPHIQQVLHERGLPEILCAIPFVESSFNLKAYSSAGAAGIWQFIEATGRQYLKIDQYVDERFDPVLATYAAAAHLAKEYEMLGSWPLTINAYNTGPGRVMKAMEQLGTNDIAKIVKRFKGSGYGFDSRNYFPEVLAAFEVYQNREQYFGDLETFAPEDTEYIVMPENTNIQDLIRASGLSADLLMNMNTAIKEDVLQGQRALPKGYFLKVPRKQKENMLLAAQELYMNSQYTAYHVVKKGEDLASIAAKYAVSEDALTKTNELLPDQKLKKGEILKLPEDYVKEQAAFATKNQNNSSGNSLDDKIKELDTADEEVEEEEVEQDGASADTPSEVEEDPAAEAEEEGESDEEAPAKIVSPNN